MSTAPKIPGPDVWDEDSEPTGITQLLMDVEAQARECAAAHEEVRRKAPEIVRRVRASSTPKMAAVKKHEPPR